MDLKLYDILNIVKSVMIGLVKLGVDMVNVYVVGGKKMMEVVREGLEIGFLSGKCLKIIVVI